MLFHSLNLEHAFKYFQTSYMNIVKPKEYYYGDE